MPASVQAVLSSRIDRLPELEKQLLQTAAVIGKTFGEALLGRVMASVAAIDETALGAPLSALAAAEFLYEAALYPQLEYSFKHPLKALDLYRAIGATGHAERLPRELDA